jgi:hypothetical protein
MKVELLPHKGKNMATQKEETLPQYRVVVDGVCVGYKSWDYGSKIVFITRLSPEEVKVIKADVEHILGDTAGHVDAPDEEKIKSRFEDKDAEQEEAASDDFN